MIRDKYWIVLLVFAAILLIASTVFPDEISDLIQTFASDWDNIKVPEKARARLVEMGPGAVPALMEALSHKDDRVRTWCEAALMQIAQEGPKRSQEVTDQLLNELQRIMQSNKATLDQRQVAVRLLARLGGQRSVKMLADGINDEAINDYVIFFLAESGSQAVPYLQRALESKSAKTQIEAAKALGRVGGKLAIVPLWMAFDKAKPELKLIILQSIIKIDGSEALTQLKKALKDSDAAVRTQAVRGVSQLGGLPEIATLEEMLRDSETVRNAAADGLITLGDRQKVAGDNENARRAYLSAYNAVFDRDLVVASAQRLRDLGEFVNIAQKFGSIYDWWVIGPFDNAGGKGFDAVYPPETEIALAKTYESMGQQVGWKKHHTKDMAGVLNALELFKPNTNVTFYALAFIESPDEIDIQIRAGSDDTLSIWLNGRRIHHHNVARGVNFDEDKVDAHLQKGVNTLLLKVCQGEGDWGFVLRIVDKDGKPIPALKVLTPMNP